MKPQFKIGDMVCVSILDYCGEIVSIEAASDAFIRIAGFVEGAILYKVRIDDSHFITTTEDALEAITPERVTDEA